MKNSFILVISLLIFSCNNEDNTEKEQIAKTLESLYEKKIVFNESLKAKSLGKDTIAYNLNNKEAKIVIYTDSTGCTPCRMKLDKWQLFISEINEISSSINFVFIYFPKNIVALDREFMFSEFSEIVYYDIKGKFAKENNLPKDYQFHTFLLGNDNEIILVGNPIHNPKIKELYLREIGKLM